MAKKNQIMVALAVLGTFGAGAAWAETRINSIVADRVGDRLYIEGADFTSGMLSLDVPYVEFNGARLAIVPTATSNTHLEAVLPDAVPDGEYTVFVSRVNRLLDPLSGVLPIQSTAHSVVVTLRATYSLTLDTPLAGPPGPKGDQGPPGISGVVLINSAASASMGNGSTLSAVATCPAGKKVVGGGYLILGNDRNKVIAVAAIATAASSYTAGAVRVAGQTGPIGATLMAQAICATAP